MTGTLQEISFYKREGEYLAREASGPDRERIMKDPKFKRTRENMSEFGGAAVLGKEFREGWTSLLQKVADSRMTSRVTGLMRKIIGGGRGPRGQRSFDLLTNKRHVEGFEFNRQQSLSAVFYAPFGMPAADANRSVVTWTVPDFRTDEEVKAPYGATHFQLVLASKVFGDFEYDAADAQYRAVEPDVMAHYGMAQSDLMPLGGAVGSDVVLSVDHSLAEALPAAAALVNAVGILFYQEVDGVPYLLESDSALKVLNVL